MKHPLLKNVLISPPFGNYFWHSNATRIRGSFTVEPRPGLIWNTLKSFRKSGDGWINQIGLRNCGVEHTKGDPSSVYSLAAIEDDDWIHLADRLDPNVTMMEVNLGCPNVSKSAIPSHGMFDLFHLAFDVVIVKIAPTDAGCSQALQLIEECDVEIIHACNTVPTDEGGISGPKLKSRSAVYVEQLRRECSDLTIIAGGGIYEPEDIDMYEQCGADHYSLSTAFMKPWTVSCLIQHASNK